MNKILDHIKNDLKNHISYPYLFNSKKNKLNILLFLKSYLNIDFRVVFLFRISQFFLKIKLKSLALIIHYRLKSRYSVDISPDCIIGPGFKIVHAFNIVIGEDVRIGKNFVCFNSVNIGNKKIGWRKEFRKNEMPTIGNNVVCSPQTIVVGKIIIEDNIILHANQIISKNLQPSIKNNDKTKYTKLLNDIE